MQYSRVSCAYENVQAVSEDKECKGKYVRLLKLFPMML